MPSCEIRWCRQKDDSLVYVNENIGDGSWRVGICHDCARRLGLKQNGDLPPSYKVKAILKEVDNGD